MIALELAWSSANEECVRATKPGREVRKWKGSSNATSGRARVQVLKDFYTHATAYVLVNIGLFVINLVTGGSWWFYWPLIFWGIGLGVHALSVFGFAGDGPWGREWERSEERRVGK